MHSPGDYRIKGLFDASAFVNLAAKGGSRALPAINEGSAIFLTFYELGNAVWKLHFLKKLSDEEAQSLLDGSLELLAQLTPLVLEKADAIEIEKLGFKRKVTFYDSAYLYAARRDNLTIVTDDEKLSKAAHSEKVETISSLSIPTC